MSSEKVEYNNLLIALLAPTWYGSQHFDVDQLFDVLLKVDEVRCLAVTVDLSEFDVVEGRVGVEQFVAEESNAPRLFCGVVQNVVLVLTVVRHGSDLQCNG